MAEVLLTLAGIVALASSIIILVTDADTYDSLIERYSFINVSLYVMLIALFVIIPMQLGAMARYETSAIPWEVWEQAVQRNGTMNGVFALIINLILLLWVFLIPGHLYANSVVKKSAERPIYPYVINTLVGVILCTPENFAYKLLVSIA